MIAIDRVSKAFSDRLALDTVSLTVARGEMLALLGHNGAGKTTLFTLMLGLRRFGDGDITIAGVSVRARPCEARRRVGSVLAPAFYEYLSGWDNLRMLATYSGTVSSAEVKRVVRLVGLADRIHERVRVYSHGMRRRLALAQALLPRPDVLLLDEWDSGLDPQGVSDLRALLAHLNRDDGTTMLISSHRPDALDGVCERIAILRAGRLTFVGDARDLDRGAVGVRLDLDDWERAGPVLYALGATQDGARTVLLPSGCTVPDLVSALVQAGVRVGAVEPLRRIAAEHWLGENDDPHGGHG